MQPKPEVRDCLEKISDSSEHLLTLINDVLDISRIESGKTKYAPIPVDITAVTDAVLDITNGFLLNRDLTFTVCRAKLETPYVLADATSHLFLFCKRIRTKYEASAHHRKVVGMALFSHKRF